MKKRSLNWEDLMTLAVLVEKGNYSATARELGLTHATIGRRMQRLESSVGKALLIRNENSIGLTPAGRSALQAAEEMAQTAGAFERRLAADTSGMNGHVRITATETLGSYFFLPRLAAFHSQHPAVHIDLILDSRILSLSRRKADIAIRLARPTQAESIAKRMGTMGYGLYIHRDHPVVSERFGTALNTQLPVCRFDESLAQIPESLWMDTHLPDAQTVFRANSLIALFEAVKSGWGAALLPSFLAAENTALVSLMPVPVLSRDIWLSYPDEYRTVPLFRTVTEWLIGISEENSRILSGI